MGKRCVKCGYERQPTDIAPEYECPKCGVVYAKAEGRGGFDPDRQGVANQGSKATKQCPYCGEEILAVAKKCKHCQSDLSGRGGSARARAKPGADYGIFLLALPVIAIMLMWFWVGNLNLLQNPGQILSFIGVATVALTALIAALEASQVGMTSNRESGTYSPVAWFFIILLLWVVGYPAYLYKRRSYGLTNFLLIGLVVTLVFVGSQVALALSIEHQKDRVRGALGLPQSNPPSQELLDLERQNLEATLDLYRLENGRYPSTSEGLNALVSRPPGTPHWKGPYITGAGAAAIYRFEYSNLDGKPVLTPK